MAAQQGIGQCGMICNQPPAQCYVPPPPPAPKFVTTSCPISKRGLIGVRRPNGAYYIYEYNMSRMCPHNCLHCQPKVTEAHLQLLYSAESPKLCTTVIFVHNSIFNTVEEYVYSFESMCLEQVFDTGLVFNPNRTCSTNVVAVIRGEDEETIVIGRDTYGGVRKEYSKDGTLFTFLAPAMVKTKMVQKLEESAEQKKVSYDYDEEDETEYESDSDADTEYLDEEGEYDEYISKLPEFTFTSCLHTRKEIIIVFNRVSCDYGRFYYDDYNGTFKRFRCDGCPKGVIESYLIPLYVVNADDGNTVFYVHNLFTGKKEQYWFNEKTGGFEQRMYSELVYDSTRHIDASCSMLFLSKGLVSSTAILRDSAGKFKKEQYCPLKSKYILIPPVPVKTLIVQRKEEEKKRNYEKKMKRKAERTAEKAADRRAAEQKTAEETARLSDPVRQVHDSYVSSYVNDCVRNLRISEESNTPIEKALQNSNHITKETTVEDYSKENQSLLVDSSAFANKANTIFPREMPQLSTPLLFDYPYGQFSVNSKSRYSNQDSQKSSEVPIPSAPFRPAYTSTNSTAPQSFGHPNLYSTNLPPY